ncbi:glycosyltransferase family 2 protein [Microvirga aerophila]|uniref:Undecaprenyl-phosphate 4-deoxy-4-formamido-L-arabinose transferase n=1 Tax=Microvirga aerophila TaxID=670291 RepID=A0A512C3F7_9HYPH|nr:glycosyltransferase family 2 protein [Microvirga aerophila]GEO18744.1 undecaprenyl-phosphate 4-deoxy-4-formamido-L-arabinose transferase [Microvirga aerophila]
MDSVTTNPARGNEAEPAEIYLSFVSPVYGSPQSLPELRRRIHAVCEKYNWQHEIILIDDRCPRGSWQVVEKLAKAHPEVTGLRLSRNFGQHSAIQAGLAYTRGEWIVVLDCDLQDIPEETPKLITKALEGYKVVRARRTQRQDRFDRKLLSKAFYGVLSYLTSTKQNPEVANFGVYHRSVIDTITSWHEQMKFFPAIIQWVGYAATEVEVDHSERFAGSSSYSYRKLLRLGVDVIISFSDRPLRLIVALGMTISLLSIAVSVFVVFGGLSGQFTVAGWATTMLSVWFLGGVIISVLGLSALYVGRILAEVKDRPTYIIDEVVKQQSNAADANLDRLSGEKTRQKAWAFSR